MKKFSILFCLAMLFLTGCNDKDKAADNTNTTTTTTTTTTSASPVATKAP